MTQRKGAPLPVKVALTAVLVLVMIPAWFYGAGFIASLIIYRSSPPEPVTVFTWLGYLKFYGYVPKVAGALKMSALAMTLPIVGFIVFLLTAKKPSLHGEAAFATRRQIKASGLLDAPDDGIIIGKLGSRFLMAGMAKYPHPMLAAPTGTGKGVGVVIPNLLNWSHSVIVFDIKQENWELTAGYRAKHGQAVYLFDPLDPQRHTHRWNPFACVSEDPNLRIADVQAIAQILFPDIEDQPPIWASSARQLFTGLALYHYETQGQVVTLGQLYRAGTMTPDSAWLKILKDRRGGPAALSDVCYAALHDYATTNDDTRTSIRKEFTSRLELYSNPLVDAATSGNDIDLSALRKRRMSVYLGVTPNTLDRLAPLMNLFFQQVVDLNTRELPEHNPKLKYQCLLLMDEFRSLGKMRVLVTAIAFLRGYGLRLLPIFQAPAQVREVYGEHAAKTFFKNHHVRVVYTPSDMDDATEISRELGNMTVKSVSRSGPLAFSKGNRSQSESEQARALMLPQEVKDLGADEEIVFAMGCPPIRATKIRWYKDPAFKNLVMPPPVVPVAPLPAYSGPDERVAGAEVPNDPAQLQKQQPGASEADSPANQAYSEDQDGSEDEGEVVWRTIEIPKHEISVEEARELADRTYAMLQR